MQLPKFKIEKQVLNVRTSSRTLKAPYHDREFACKVLKQIKLVKTKQLPKLKFLFNT